MQLNVVGVKDIRRYQELALQSRLRIPLIFGLDVIHGYRTGFPLPLAEAASFDLAMIEEAACYNALESAADGLNWVFARARPLSREPCSPSLCCERRRGHGYRPNRPFLPYQPIPLYVR